MSALYLVPVDEPSYQATLAQKIDLTEWTDRPDDFPAKAHVWGVRTNPEQGPWPRNERTWEQMETGEPLLFYRNVKGRFFATGRIGAMGKTDYVRNEFWKGGPADSVYEVMDYDEDIDLSASRVKSLLGYDEGFIVRGTHRVSEDRPIKRLIETIDIDG
jgi:hypothetical protein